MRGKREGGRTDQTTERENSVNIVTSLTRLPLKKKRETQEGTWKERLREKKVKKGRGKEAQGLGCGEGSG